jgi:protein TonB
MTNTPTPKDTARPEAPQGPGVVSTGWLAAQSTFEHRDERKLGRAMASSLVAHGAMLVVILLIFSIQPEQRVLPAPPVNYDIVYLQQPGPGGGGGGSPEPAPPKPLELPKPKPAEPTPIIPEPVKPDPPPIPTLTAPVQTNAANLVQAAGQNSVSLASYGGGGRGRGVGSGIGNGVGPGDGTGSGGGPPGPGNGIEYPTLLHEEKPVYTSEGMRAKVQGVVAIDAVLAKDGRVSRVQVAANGSLDRKFGLDQAALDAARKWLFTPCTQQGKPVECQIRIELEFRIH